MTIEDKVKQLYKDEGYSVRGAVQSLGILCATGIVMMGKSHKAFLIKSDGLDILITVKVKPKGENDGN